MDNTDLSLIHQQMMGRAIRRRVSRKIPKVHIIYLGFGSRFTKFKQHSSKSIKAFRKNV